MEQRDIPGFVKRLRYRMDLTQEQFAREVGVTFSTVNVWENGHRRPQPYLMKRLLEMDASFGQGTAEGGKKPERKPKRER